LCGILLMIAAVCIRPRGSYFSERLRAHIFRLNTLSGKESFSESTVLMARWILLQRATGQAATNDRLCALLHLRNVQAHALRTRLSPDIERLEMMCPTDAALGASFNRLASCTTQQLMSLLDVQVAGKQFVPRSLTSYAHGLVSEH
jgi:hypothetical protein